MDTFNSCYAFTPWGAGAADGSIIFNVIDHALYEHPFVIAVYNMAAAESEGVSMVGYTGGMVAEMLA